MFMLLQAQALSCPAMTEVAREFLSQTSDS